MASTKNKSGTSTTLVVLAVGMLIWLVVKFWYVIVGAALLALVLFLVIRGLRYLDGRRHQRRAERAALLSRCHTQNASYLADPAAYLHALEGSLGTVTDPAARSPFELGSAPHPTAKPNLRKPA